jgi:hypothetical protein
MKRAQTVLGSNPKGDIKQSMSHSTVVPMGDDIVFDNRVSCAALRKGEPGGLDHLVPSTVSKQQSAELGLSRKKRTATQSQQISFGDLPTSKAAVNKAKLARTYREACPPLSLGPLSQEEDASGLPPPLNPDMLIDLPAFHEHRENEGDSDDHERRETRFSHHDDDTASGGRHNGKEEGEVDDEVEGQVEEG